MTDQPSGEVILYQRDDGAPALEVRLDAETVWLSQQQIADLFRTSRTNVVEHIQHVYEEGELVEATTCRKFRQVRTEGSRQVAREIPFYNLDLIISVGYRVKSKVATQFRIWAIERLRDYDEGQIEAAPGAMPGWMLTTDEARAIIVQVGAEFPADGLFGRERGDALDGIIAAIYQGFGGEELPDRRGEGGESALFRCEGPSAVRWQQAQCCRSLRHLPRAKWHPERCRRSPTDLEQRACRDHADGRDERPEGERPHGRSPRPHALGGRLLSRIDDLIAQNSPNGVEFRAFGDVGLFL